MARKRKNKVGADEQHKQSIVWRIAAYIRLSREDGNDESLSVTNQRKIILEYLEEHFVEQDYILVDFYVDDGRTGTTEDTRPAFLRMVEDIEAGRINCVLCKTLSRAFRNYADQGRFLEEYLPARNCRFISIGNPHVDTFADPGCIQNLEIPINGLMNDRFAAKTSADVRRTFNTKRRRGEFIGAFPPYGYCKSPEDKNKLLVDEEAAQVVRDIFYWFVAEGMSKMGIAKRLNEQGIPNPSAYKRAKGLNFHTPYTAGNDGLWNPTTIARILRDSLYIGVMRQGRQRVVSYKVHARVSVPENDWFVVENAVPPVVSRELFQAAQDLHGRDTRTAPQQRAVYPFSGLLFCADCGKGMHRRSSKGYVYYACRTFTDKSTSRCTNHSIREDAVATAVLTVIQKLIKLVGSLDEIVDQIHNAPGMRAEPERLRERMEQRVKDLDRIADQLDEAYGDWKSGDISHEQYRRMKGKYEEKICLLREQMEYLQREYDALVGSAAVEDPYLTTFLRERNIQELSRGLLVELLHAVYIHEGGEMEIVFRFQDPYQRILDFAGNASAKFCGDENPAAL